MRAATRTAEIHNPNRDGRSRDFQVRIPAPFLKDRTISPTAKLLLAILKAHADGSTGECFVTSATIEKLLDCGRDKRERAQRELAGLGYVRLGWRRGFRGKWARRVFFVSDSPCPDLTAAVKIGNLHQFPQSSHVTSVPTILTKALTEAFRGDLT